jgi:hypothetical protein
MGVQGSHTYLESLALAVAPREGELEAVRGDSVLYVYVNPDHFRGLKPEVLSSGHDHKGGTGGDDADLP